ncbi:factor of DNA methylation 1 [Herrania umbratica]|uniref:Factor of DNA methylation 1 n=1 Tax=Herrania umbratica TaxID=108875 RepID=A0A6J1BA32_9ROSI|nr:factor of DNA methylation 1 [Herrania umbratica]
MERHYFAEELKKERRLVWNLIHEIDYKNQQLSEMERKYDETTATLRGLVDGLIAKINSKDSMLLDWELKYNTTVRRLMDENAKLQDEFVEELKKVKSENIKLKCKLGQRTKELEECKSQSDLERRTLINEMEVLKENLPRQNLVEVDKTSSAQVAALRKELEEKSEALLDLESRYNCLTVKQILTNQELQDARKESINGLKDMLNSRTTLGVKRMGEINQNAFEVACSLKFPNEDWQEISAKLCSSWEQNVQDPKWHPFKRIPFRGNLQEIVDEDDEKLKELRNEYGEAAFEAVTTALMEMNEYNASGRYAVPEIWNLKERRRASMKEIIQYIIKQLKTQKRKRKLT